MKYRFQLLVSTIIIGCTVVIATGHACDGEVIRTTKTSRTINRTISGSPRTALVSMGGVSNGEGVAATSPVKRAFLGITMATSTFDGVQIMDVTRNSGAMKAGLRSGDVVVAINGTTIKSPDDVSQVITSKKPGDNIVVTFTRRGTTSTVAATLGERISSGNVATSPGFQQFQWNAPDNVNLENLDVLASTEVELATDNPCEKLRELNGTAFLGIWIDQSRSGKVYLTGTLENTGAQEAGLQRGDAITQIDGKTVTNFEDSRAEIRSHKPGETVTVTFVRNGEQQTVQARLVSLGETKKEVIRSLEARCAEKSIPQDVTRGELIQEPFLGVANVPTIVQGVPLPQAIEQPEVVIPDVNNTTMVYGEPIELNNEIRSITPEENSLLSVSPNPATGVVQLHFRNTEDTPFTITINDGSGRSVMEVKVSSHSGEYDTPLDLTKLPRGVYFISLQQGDAVHKTKVVLH